MVNGGQYEWAWGSAQYKCNPLETTRRLKRHEPDAAKWTSSNPSILNSIKFYLIFINLIHYFFYWDVPPKPHSCVSLYHKWKHRRQQKMIFKMLKVQDERYFTFLVNFYVKIKFIFYLTCLITCYSCDDLSPLFFQSITALVISLIIDVT